MYVSLHPPTPHQLNLIFGPTMSSREQRGDKNLINFWTHWGAAVVFLYSHYCSVPKTQRVTAVFPSEAKDGAKVVDI